MNDIDTTTNDSGEGDTNKPDTAAAAKCGKTAKDKLAESLLAGLAEENANPDAEDERFMAQCLAITDEDRY